MRDTEKGIQRIEIPLSEYILDRLLSSDSEDEMFRILSTQHTGLPRFDSRDVMELSWQEATDDLRREGFIAIAVLQVARGHRLLAEFVIEHADIRVERDHDCFRVYCEQHDSCGTLELRHDSLRPLHLDPDEPHHLDALRDLREAKSV